MPKYKITIEYNGTSFNGWAPQKNSLSISNLIVDAVHQFYKGEVKLHGAGRTDTGVHAKGQVAHFCIEKDMSNRSMMNAINFYLKSKDIVILKVEKMPIESDFHARFSAKERVYKYIICERKARLTFEKNLYWHYYYDLDISLLQKASKLLIGTHDLSSFRGKGCQANSPIRTINDIKIFRNNNNPDLIEFIISAPSFVYHQVRNIIGTIVLVGSKKITIEDFQTIINSKDRTKAGITAPPHGLYFLEIKY